MHYRNNISTSLLFTFDLKPEIDGLRLGMDVFLFKYACEDLDIMFSNGI